MDVKPILATPNFRINASGEAREESARDRGDREQRQRAKTAPESLVETPAQDRSGDLTTLPPEVSQPIDSGTVVELLAHRPPARNFPEAFKKLAAQLERNSVVSDGKKLDKSL